MGCSIACFYISMFCFLLLKYLTALKEIFTNRQKNAFNAALVAFFCDVGYQRFALTNFCVTALLLVEYAGFYYTGQQKNWQEKFPEN